MTKIIKMYEVQTLVAKKRKNDIKTDKGNQNNNSTKLRL